MTCPTCQGRGVLSESKGFYSVTYGCPACSGPSALKPDVQSQLDEHVTNSIAYGGNMDENEVMDERLREIGEAFERGVSMGRREMTLDEYQGRAHATAVYPANMAVLYNVLKLAGEAGEVAEKVGKHLRDGTLELAATDDGDVMLIQADPDIDVREGLLKEIGDVLWYVQELAGAFGYELSEVAAANLDKLASRQERGVLKGDGDDR